MCRAVDDRYICMYVHAIIQSIFTGTAASEGVSIQTGISGILIVSTCFFNVLHFSATGCPEKKNNLGKFKYVS